MRIALPIPMKRDTANVKADGVADLIKRLATRLVARCSRYVPYAINPIRISQELQNTVLTNQSSPVTPINSKEPKKAAKTEYSAPYSAGDGVWNDDKSTQSRMRKIPAAIPY